MDKKAPDNFNDAMQELEELTSEFENGDVDLEAGIPKFKRGMELVRFLKKRLNDMENEVEEIKVQFTDVDDSSANPESVDGVGMQKSTDDDRASKDIPF